MGACCGKEGCACVGVSSSWCCGAAGAQRLLRQLWTVGVAGTAALCLCWESRDVLGKQNPKWLGTFNISHWPCILAVGECAHLSRWLTSCSSTGWRWVSRVVWFYHFLAPQIPGCPAGSADRGELGLYLMGLFLPTSEEKCVITRCSRASLVWSCSLAVSQAIFIKDEVTGHTV